MTIYNQIYNQMMKLIISGSWKIGDQIRITNLKEVLVIDKYNHRTSFRCGFNITETLVTPEDQSSLLDNATGSSNFAAKGAHRLQFSLALKKIDYDATADSNFVELF